MCLYVALYWIYDWIVPNYHRAMDGDENSIKFMIMFSLVIILSLILLIALMVSIAAVILMSVELYRD